MLSGLAADFSPLATKSPAAPCFASRLFGRGKSLPLGSVVGSTVVKRQVAETHARGGEVGWPRGSVAPLPVIRGEPLGRRLRLAFG